MDRACGADAAVRRAIVLRVDRCRALSIVELAKSLTRLRVRDERR